MYNRSEIHDRFEMSAVDWVARQFGFEANVCGGGKGSFNMEALQAHKASYAIFHRSSFAAWDHLQWVKDGRHPFALISHSYAPVEKIEKEMRQLQKDFPGLVAVHIPEKSWWNEDCKPFIVMRRNSYDGSWGAYCVSRLPNSDRRLTASPTDRIARWPA